MILAASFVKTPVPYLPRWARRLATPALFRFYPAASRAKALLGGYGTREVRRLLAEAHAIAGVEALACRARATLSIDATDALAACPVPVLYLRARKDGVIRGSHADEIRAAAAVVEIADIDGPHLALVTNPAAAWDALTRVHGCRGTACLPDARKRRERTVTLRGSRPGRRRGGCSCRRCRCRRSRRRPG